MRGKNILWLSLIAMVLGTMMVNIGIGQVAGTKIEILPTRIPDTPLLGHPDDEYEMTLEVTRAHDLWAVGLDIQIAPYSSVLLASEFFAGSFLKQGDYVVYQAVSIDALAGVIHVTLTRLPIDIYGNPMPVEGVSGSGTLLTFKLTVMEAGESPIDIISSILVSSEGEEMNHNAFGSIYYGTTAALVNVEMPTGHKINAGDVFVIESQVRNDGDIPLKVRVRFTIRREADARTIIIRSGQLYGGGGLGEPLPYEYLYVDGYRENPLIGGHEWYNEGDSMVGEPDDNYMYANTAYAWSMFYSFEDITLAGRTIQNVDLYGYTSQPDGSTGWDFDPYVMPWGAWCDSMGGSLGWDWTGGRYYSGGPYDMPEYYINGAIHTEAAINSAEVFIENYCPSGPEQRIDAMRWKVEFAAITPTTPPEYDLLPGQQLELGVVTWPSTEDHIGRYVAECTIEYTSEFVKWNSWGSHTKQLKFKIVEG